MSTVRAVRRWSASRFRQATAPLRVLPDFLVIGVQKGGTTSLYRWITQHPQVVSATTAKELHYFDGEPERWPVRYRRHFPRRTVMTSGALTGGRPAVTGEATPSYVFHPAVPARVASVVPDVRLIVVLREPVGRALSHYAMNVRKGYEPLPLHEAIEAEQERIADGHRLAMAGRPLPRSNPYLRFSYLERGFYAKQLRRWYAHFPTQQLLVLETGQLFSQPETTFARVLDFLGLDPVPLADTRNHNPGDSVEVTPAERAALAERFVDANADLEHLVGVTWPGP